MAIPNEAIKRQERYLAKIAGQESTLPEKPIARKEFYLAKAAGQSVETPEPITREEMYLDAIAEGGGGGGSATLVTKSIAANGTYNASSDSADGYSSVTVNVPNTYAAADEGKVVSNGALVAQTSDTYTANGTYDTTTKNSVTVNVPSGSPTLTTKTITANGTYNASSDSADGYSSVTVNVSGGGGDDSFQKLIDGSITTVTVPDGTTSIRPYAFAACTSMTSLSIPEGISIVPDDVAYDCSALKTVVLPSTITSIGRGAFYGGSTITSLTSLTIYATTPPTFVGSVGSTIHVDARRGKIYVPAGSVSAYQSAWSELASYITAIT